MLSRHVHSASVTLPVPQPASTAFSTSFEGLTGAPAGWTGSGATPNAGNFGNAHSGTYTLSHQITAGLAAGTPTNLQRTVTGLTAGLTYTFSAWVRINVAADFPVGISISGRAAAAPTPQSQALGWRQYTYTFVATATSHVLNLIVTTVGTWSGGVADWDDILVTTPAADVPTPFDLPIKGGSVTLDEGWAPYAQATLEIPIPALNVLYALDPRKNVRVNLTLTSAYGDVQGDWNPEGYIPPTTRPFNLRLTGRRTNHKDGTLTLALASDETTLQSYSWVDTNPRPLSTTSAVTAVKDVFALALPGSTLNVLADLTNKPTITRTNLATNPSFETNTTGYTAQRCNISRVASNPSVGTYSLMIIPNTAGQSAFVNLGAGDVGGGMRGGLVAGKTYTISANFRLVSNTVGGSATGSSIQVNYKSASASTYTTATVSTFFNTPSNVRLSVTFSLPADTSEVAVRFYHPGSAVTGQAPLYLDAVMVEETDEYRGYFDGATANTPEQTTAWTGVAHASTSTAVVRANVGGNATLWQPGVSAFDYLAPLLTATGMRLFCDEQRVWRLVDSAYNIPGSVRLSEGINLVDGSDEIARNNDGTWFDAVVVKYKWTDFDGATQIKYDAAYMPNYQQCRLIEIEAAYPGPGAASYILSRSYGRGRVLSLRGISDYSAQPGMEATATLPLSPVQSGGVSAVTWDLGADEMDVETRGLVDTPLTAWNQQPTGKTWQDVPAGVTWTNFTP